MRREPAAPRQPTQNTVVTRSLDTNAPVAGSRCFAIVS